MAGQQHDSAPSRPPAPVPLRYQHRLCPSRRRGRVQLLAGDRLDAPHPDLNSPFHTSHLGRVWPDDHPSSQSGRGPVSGPRSARQGHTKARWRGAGRSLERTSSRPGRWPVSGGGPVPGWLNVLVILFFWNAAKFAWLATLSPFFLLAHRLWSARDESSAHRHQSEPGSSSTPCSPRPAVSTPAARSRTPSPSWCSAQPSWPPCAERPAEYTSALAGPAQSCELCAEGCEFGPGGR
jgi:hypothetical protein